MEQVKLVVTVLTVAIGGVGAYLRLYFGPLMTQLKEDMNNLNTRIQRIEGWIFKQSE